MISAKMFTVNEAGVFNRYENWKQKMLECHATVYCNKQRLHVNLILDYANT
jgi:hypothetical protein